MRSMFTDRIFGSSLTCENLDFSKFAYIGPFFRSNVNCKLDWPEFDNMSKYAANRWNSNRYDFHMKIAFIMDIFVRFPLNEIFDRLRIHITLLFVKF